MLWRCEVSGVNTEEHNDKIADTNASILDVYVAAPPDKKNGFGIFNGAWSSDVPGYGFGKSGLFDDARIYWFENQCGGFRGKQILELGPLEGGHTYMLSRAGAANITSIESNTTSFLKCLIVQNALKFEANFILGDFRPYLADTTETFDVLVASGILYHMTDPVKLLQDMAKRAKSICLWTHYYDENIIVSNEKLNQKFEKTPIVQNFGSREVTLFKQSYLTALQWQGFCGGSAPISYWLTMDSIIGILSDLGFEVSIGANDRDHPNGPAMTCFAFRPE
jgi:hypothetical protein